MNLGGSIKINKCGMLIITLIFLLIFYYLTFSKKSSNAANNYGIMKNTNEINLRKLLIGSIQAAQKGGIEVLSVSKLIEINAKIKGKTLEGANDLITDADLKSHCVMAQGLQRIFPKLKIISEEDVTNVKCPELKSFDLDPTVLHDSVQVADENVHIDDVAVWIDPLDATQEFSEKLFEYVTTMVCVAVKGKPIIGVIHNPFTQKTTWAWYERSMSEDLTKVKIDESLAKTPIFIVSRSHSGDVKELTKKAFGDSAIVKPAAGAGYKVLQVIFNNATAYIHSAQIKKWDICAGNAILNAVGGQMTNLQNEQIDYTANSNQINSNGLLATLVHHKMYLTKISSNLPNTNQLT